MSKAGTTRLLSQLAAQSVTFFALGKSLTGRGLLWSKKLIQSGDFRRIEWGYLREHSLDEVLECSVLIHPGDDRSDMVGDADYTLLGERLPNEIPVRLAILENPFF